MQSTYYSLVKETTKGKETNIAVLGRKRKKEGKRRKGRRDHGKKGSYSFYCIIIRIYFTDSI
jgi:hypothetical protein